uniref:Uncharacterized protein n=1 Tax=Arion vulgaris TaxID=1028688 RepID=A0A0B7BK88_9EUPU
MRSCHLQYFCKHKSQSYTPQDAFDTYSSQIEYQKKKKRENSKMYPTYRTQAALENTQEQQNVSNILDLNCKIQNLPVNLPLT